MNPLTYRRLGDPLWYGELQLLYPKAQDGIELLPPGTKTNNQYDPQLYCRWFNKDRTNIVEREKSKFERENLQFLQNDQQQFLLSGDFPRNGRADQIQVQYRDNILPMYPGYFRN